MVMDGFLRGMDTQQIITYPTDNGHRVSGRLWRREHLADYDLFEKREEIMSRLMY